MEYILMHKNIEVLSLTLDDDLGVIVSANEVYNPKHIPIGIHLIDGKVSKRDILHWWSNRSIPVSRSGVKRIMRELNLLDVSTLVAKSYALSLSDQYWIRPHNSSILWEDINFFDNDFSEDIGNILFGYRNSNHLFDFKSPDSTSNGWLKKRWKIIDGKRYLIKGSSVMFQEPFNEVIASEVAKRLNIDHQEYSLIFDDNKPYSMCEDFVNKDTDFVDASAICHVLEKSPQDTKFQHFKKCCDYLNIPNFNRRIDEMLLLDYIIVNQDRHFGNFGAIRNADTLEFIDFAPIFDCGTSLRYDTPSQYIDIALDVESQPFLDTHSQQIGLVSSLNGFDLTPLEDITVWLDNFLKDKHVSVYVDTYRRERLCELLKYRIESLRDTIEKALK